VLSSLFVENMQHEFLRPITRHKPIARIGGSALLVYEGDFDLRKAAGATESYAAWWAMNEGRFETALRHARKGVEIAPENFYVRLQYCRALVANDIFDLAKTECHVTRALLFESTKVDRQTANGLTQAIMARRALDAGRLQSALEHARAAIVLAPKSGTAHFEYCRALMTARDRGAERECENARVFGRNSANPPPNTTSTSIDLMLSALGERPR
jgi:tetratricopeptide (TPR) repeat protein